MSSDERIKNGDQLPPIGEMLVGRPTRWHGRTVSWSQKGVPIPVFLARFHVADGCLGDRAKHGIYLFGACYDTSEALFDGQPLQDSIFFEFFVVLKDRDGGWDLRRLLQQRSVTFSEGEDSKDFVFVRSMRKPDQGDARKLPVWESAGEAVWPTSHGEPMTFIGQVRTDHIESNGKKQVWDDTLYLFTNLGEPVEFKIVTQSHGLQSPDEHYASEE